MYKKFILLILLAASSFMTQAVETLVFMRHGEKPDNNSGQLTCQGLNRSLALPDVLISRYGKADEIYASAPKQKKLGNSLRSLQTISPTAIQLSVPINLNYHADEIKPLQKTLLDSDKHNKLIFITWEHNNLEKLVKNIIKSFGGDASLVPSWQKNDFDTIYVLVIDHQKQEVIFKVEQEGLNNLSMICPTR